MSNREYQIEDVYITETAIRQYQVGGVLTEESIPTAANGLPLDFGKLEYWQDGLPVPVMVNNTTGINLGNLEYWLNGLPVQVLTQNITARSIHQWRKSRRMARRPLPMGQLLVPSVQTITLTKLTPFNVADVLGTIQANGGTLPYTWTITRQLLSS